MFETIRRQGGGMVGFDSSTISSAIAKAGFDLVENYLHSLLRRLLGRQAA